MGVGLAALATWPLLGTLLRATTTTTTTTHGVQVSRRDVAPAAGTPSPIPWQPDDFDWAVLATVSGPGLAVNVTKNPKAAEILTKTGGSAAARAPSGDVVDLNFAVGTRWADNDTIAAVLPGINVRDPRDQQGLCFTADKSSDGSILCAQGILATVASIGMAYASLRTETTLGWYVRPEPRFKDGRTDIQEYTTVERRPKGVVDGARRRRRRRQQKQQQDQYQAFHERTLGALLSETLGDSAAIVGHTGEGHPLYARAVDKDDDNDDNVDNVDNGPLHPRVPIFRVRHPAHGWLDLASRADVGGTHFAVRLAPEEEEDADPVTKAPPTTTTTRDQQEPPPDPKFEQTAGWFTQVYFNSEAANADPCNPKFDARRGYDTILASLKCVMGQRIPERFPVIAMQWYDQDCHATLGFAYLAFFGNSTGLDTLDHVRPMDMPVPVCGS